MGDDGATAVVVGVRVRPFNKREEELEATCCISMSGPQTTIVDEFGKDTSFTFDEATQSTVRAYHDQRYVYEKFGQRVLDNAWAGYHCCLFAYGQTGAGKSYSMVGYGTNKGIVPISCDEIFQRLSDPEQLKGKVFEVTTSMVEIYNEAVQDLLVNFEDRPKKGLEIRESKALGIYIDGVQKRTVSSYAAIEGVIDEGTSNRTVGSTLMNATSSRAHTVITIELKQAYNARPDDFKVSMINLVDLAGSEKASQTGASGDRLKEGCAINKSLTALGNVIEKLAQRSQGKKDVRIPYRESKLTRLLQNALGGTSKTIMICALSPASSNFEETLSTLRYADRAKKIKNAAQVVANPQDKLVQELSEENERLKKLLEEVEKNGGVLPADSKGGGGGGGGGKGPRLTPEMEAKIKAQEEEVRRAKAALADMKKSYEEKLEESEKNKWKMAARRISLTRRHSRVVGRVPMMMNINSDDLLTGRMKHGFGPDEVVTVTNPKGIPSMGGQGPGFDSGSELSESEEDVNGKYKRKRRKNMLVQLNSKYVFRGHATIKNVLEENRCILEARGEARSWTYINGRSYNDTVEADKYRYEEQTKKTEAYEAYISGVATAEHMILLGQDPDTPQEPPALLPENGVVVRHGDRLVFGKAIYLFVDPAMGIPETFLLSGHVTFESARSEVPQDYWTKAHLRMKGVVAKYRAEQEAQDPTMAAKKSKKKRAKGQAGVKFSDQAHSADGDDATAGDVDGVNEDEMDDPFDEYEDEDDWIASEVEDPREKERVRILEDNEQLRMDLMDRDHEVDQLKETVRLRDNAIDSRDREIRSLRDDLFKLRAEVSRLRGAHEAQASGEDRRALRSLQKKHAKEAAEGNVRGLPSKPPAGPEALQKVVNNTFDTTKKTLDILNKQILDFSREKTREMRQLRKKKRVKDEAEDMKRLAAMEEELEARSMVCPCGKMYKGDAKFCRYCGRKRELPEELVKLRKSRMQKKPGIVLCGSCGTPLDKDCKFCLSCGARRPKEEGDGSDSGMSGSSESNEEL
eukprot:TRINITY_DN2586_c0_g2_i3.p1 TRINITY_DN2586_c0_g2~~TRINITY_DN2586_c0_g2_i3.p1  ORF type:complete len:1057 (+),score=326.94 TRINITY_DN2586_c0_g2_i3:84-3173(+)